jgi:hypothetical protein
MSLERCDACDGQPTKPHDKKKEKTKRQLDHKRNAKYHSHIYNVSTTPRIPLRHATGNTSFCHLPSILLLYTQSTQTASYAYDVKLLVKLCTTSFSLFSNSLLNEPSLSIWLIISDSFVRRWLKKSCSHWVTLLTGTGSR